MTIFVWSNGAKFEEVVNQYTSAAYPVGIGPANPSILQSLGSINGSVQLLRNVSLEGTREVVAVS